jgi:hypothetical protein
LLHGLISTPLVKKHQHKKSVERHGLNKFLPRIGYGEGGRRPDKVRVFPTG